MIQQCCIANSQLKRRDDSEIRSQGLDIIS
jgi:hypothetical protein